MEKPSLHHFDEQDAGPVWLLPDRNRPSYPTQGVSSGCASLAALLEWLRPFSRKSMLRLALAIFGWMWSRGQAGWDALSDRCQIDRSERRGNRVCQNGSIGRRLPGHDKILEDGGLIRCRLDREPLG